MKNTLILIIMSLTMQSSTNKIYIFSTKTNIKDWRGVNDDVMGGISNSTMVLNQEGNGHFSGHVSLANNGGFASVQLNTNISLDDTNKHILIRVKGDGKRYEFRLKGKISQYESYVSQFETSGEWEIIKLAIRDFYPQFRGQKLNIPNFNFKNIEQISFMITNKKEEDFNLLIDWIGLE